MNSKYGVTKISGIGNDYTEIFPWLPKSITHIKFFNFTSLHFIINATNISRSINNNNVGNKVVSKIMPFLFSGLGLDCSFRLDSFPNLVYLHLSNDFVGDIINLPPSLQILHTGNKFYSSLPPLPSSLVELHFGDDFNSPINNLPPSLTILHIGHRFNQDLSLPSNLIQLHFSRSSCFDGALLLPLTLQSLTIGSYYIKGIDSFPPSLSSLSYLSPVIDGSLLPSSLTSLEVVQNIPCLPSSLKHLIYWGSRIDCPLPSSLLTLQLGKGFNCFLPLPLNLLSLHMSIESDQCPLDTLPDSLTSLIIDSNYNFPILHFPNNITHLKLGSGYNHPILSLPPFITTLIFSQNFDCALPPLPSSIEVLSLFNSFNDSLPLLPKIKILIFGDKFNQIIDESKPLPPSLDTVIFGSHFDHPLHCFPPSLHHLDVGPLFNHPLILPLTLRTLTLGKSFSHSLPFPPPFFSRYHILQNEPLFSTVPRNSFYEVSRFPRDPLKYIF